MEDCVSEAVGVDDKHFKAVRADKVHATETKVRIVLEVMDE
jgi:hypothetical protein